MNYDAANILAGHLRESPEVKEYQQLKALVEQSDTARALLKEYKRLQMLVQMSAMSGQTLPQEETARFQQISSLLYAGTDTSRFLLSEMRLQQVLADIYTIIAKASGMSLEMPGMQ